MRRLRRAARKGEEPHRDSHLARHVPDCAQTRAGLSGRACCAQVGIGHQGSAAEARGILHCAQHRDDLFRLRRKRPQCVHYVQHVVPGPLQVPSKSAEGARAVEAIKGVVEDAKGKAKEAGGTVAGRNDLFGDALNDTLVVQARNGL